MKYSAGAGSESRPSSVWSQKPARECGRDASSSCARHNRLLPLLRGSFIPPKPIRQLRELTRMRVHIQQDRNRVITGMARLLETVNIKLASVATNIVGKSGLTLASLFFRLAQRRDLKKAAVAHRILIIAWHILAEGTVYRERGGDHFDRRNPEQTARKLTRRLENIGFQVMLVRRRWAAERPRPPAVDPLKCPKCSRWRLPRYIHVLPKGSLHPTST